MEIIVKVVQVHWSIEVSIILEITIVRKQMINVILTRFSMIDLFLLLILIKQYMLVRFLWSRLLTYFMDGSVSS